MNRRMGTPPDATGPGAMATVRRIYIRPAGKGPVGRACLTGKTNKKNTAPSVPI